MANFRFLSVIFICANFVGGSIGQNPNFRLPRTLLPISYRLEVLSILDEIPQHPRFSAPSRVWISLNCTAATDTITLHALELTIDTGNITLRNSAGVSLPIARFDAELVNDFFMIILSSPLAPGEVYELFIPYIAPISPDRLDGIYLDSYVDPANNQTKYVSTTLFAANNARRAFPCWDEPDFKAVFNISLGRSEAYHALSNTHLISSAALAEIPGWILDTFAPTPPMSTYLVAMIVSDLTFEQAPDTPGAPIHRVYAPYYFIQRGGGVYSANLSLNVNAGFENYYGIDYPMQKLDNVALPQFYYNAMENWGLMTYADRVLLYFEGETSAQQRYQLSLTVSHEVSHNFFGNIVTAKWWTWIWLNEGWATFASHQGLEMTYPELRPWDNFIPQIYQTAMIMDESVNTHPVASPPTTPASVGGVYDDIVYEKAASLIRMMQNFVTEPVLREGMRRYLQKWQYGVTEQDDLWVEIQGALDEVGSGTLLPPGASVKGIMDTWTLQSGYPLVSLVRSSPTEVTFFQRQYVLNGIPSGDERWWIPVQIQVLTGPSPGVRSFWMSPEGGNVTLPLGEGEIFFVNPESIGYFRTMYTKKMVQQLGQLLETGEESRSSSPLTPVMRAKLLDDSFALGFSGHIPLDVVLDLTKYLNTEESFIVWKSVGRSLIKLGNILRQAENKAGNLFSDYILNKIKRAQESLHGKASTISEDYAKEELDQLVTYFSPEPELILADKVEDEITRILKPGQKSQLPKYGDDLELGAQALGKWSETRVVAWNVLRRMLQSVKTSVEGNAVLNLLSYLCPYGNMEDDITAVTRIQEEFEHNAKATLDNCLDIIGKNVGGKVKLSPVAKSWVIKR